MTRFFISALAWLPAVAFAAGQTPAASRMPDGSRDAYIGLGAVSAPRYAGAEMRKLSALPALQLAWSNGVFVSGGNLGWHLSESPTVEYGPLLGWQAPRRADGDDVAMDTVTGAGGGQPRLNKRADKVLPRGLIGMDDVAARLLVGGFMNYYLTPDWRLTNSVLAGAGNDQHGVLWRLGIQRLGLEFGHHTLAFSAGIDVANGAYNSSYSGVSAAESARSGYAVYRAAGGIRQLRVGTRWNWALSPSWLLTSGIDASRLVDAASRSPLAVRPGGVAVSTVLGYRF